MVHLTIDGIFFDSVKYDVYFTNMGGAFDVQGYAQNYIILISEITRITFPPALPFKHQNFSWYPVFKRNPYKMCCLPL